MLLDTHSFIWAILMPHMLSPAAATALGDRRNKVCVSLVSAWEMAIKVQTAKLTLDRSIKDLFTVDLLTPDFSLLPLQLDHIIALSSLELHHRDPFDRLLVAQAIAENMPIVSCDTMLDRYPVTRLWQARLTPNFSCS